MTFKHWSRHSPTSGQGGVLVVQASVAAYLQDLPSNFFPYELLNARNQKKYYQRATYKDEISTFPQPSTVHVFQEIDPLNTIVTTRSAYDEPLEVSPRGT
jgi:hypothetical protein